MKPLGTKKSPLRFNTLSDYHVINDRLTRYFRAKLIYTHGKIKKKTTRSGNGYSRDAFTMSKVGSYNSSIPRASVTEKTVFYGADIESLEKSID